MKKTLFAFALVLFGLVQIQASEAREFSLGGSTANVKNGKDYDQLELGYASSATVPRLGLVDYSALAELNSTQKTVGLTGGRKLLVNKAVVTPGVELGLGEVEVARKIKSGKKSTTVVDDEGYAFGGASVGVSYPLPQKGFSLKGGLRYRKAFTNDVDFKETRVSGGVNYALTDSRTLGLEARKTTGTVKSDGFALQFTQKF
jgi:hypothetical protein